ncbi:MAG: ATP-binding cassette domain-containing protein [Spirochaetaceae bacterium]
MSLEFDIKLPRLNYKLELKGHFGKGITGIYGDSGAGKTSLFNILAGLEKPTEGFVKLNNRYITHVEKKINTPPNKRNVGIVFQDNLLFPHLTIEENLRFGLRYIKKQNVDFNKIVEILNLRKILSAKPYLVSGGEAQRIAIGRAILTSPELLLLDEPFNAVDYCLRSNILRYIKGLNKELDIPILVISHDFNDLKFMTNTLYKINLGKVS